MIPLIVFLVVVIGVRSRCCSSPVGSPSRSGPRRAIGYGPTSPVRYQPTASAVIDYTRFAHARAGHGNTALLRYADSRLMVVLPDALCPPPALDSLETAIRGRRMV